MQSTDSKVNTEANVQDYIDPSVNVAEIENVHVPRSELPVDSDAPSAYDLARAAQDKAKFYDDKNASKEGVTRSALDHGQEAVLSPEAQESLRKSQDQKSSDRSIADKILHPTKK